MASGGEGGRNREEEAVVEELRDMKVSRGLTGLRRETKWNSARMVRRVEGL